jgi:hypothetical protein
MATDLYSGLVGALIGSGIGAAVTFLAQKTQTTRLIQAGTEQYRVAADAERQRAAEAADQERRAARRELGRAAAFDLLQVLADVDCAVPHLRLAGMPRFRGSSFRAPDWQVEQADYAEHALDSLRRALMVQVPVVGDDKLTARWDRLTVLARELSTMEGNERPVSDRDGNVITPPNVRIGRSKQDLEQYLRYVHTTVRAWLDDTPLPPDLEAPVLQREDVEVWRWDGI